MSRTILEEDFRQLNGDSAISPPMIYRSQPKGQKRMMAPKGQAYQPDWLCSLTSDVYVANYTGWFTSFTEFKGTLESIYLPWDLILASIFSELEMLSWKSRGLWIRVDCLLRKLFYMLS